MTNNQVLLLLRQAADDIRNAIRGSPETRLSSLVAAATKVSMAEDSKEVYWGAETKSRGPTLRALLQEVKAGLRVGSSNDALRALEMIVAYLEKEPEGPAINYDAEALFVRLKGALEAENLSNALALIDEYSGSCEGDVILQDGRMHSIREVIAGIRKWLWDSMQMKGNAHRWTEAALMSLKRQEKAAPKFDID